MRNMESKILAVADEMIAGVRERGDAYVAETIARFDHVSLAPGEISSAAFASDGQRSHWLVTSFRENKTGRDIVCLWNMRLDELMKLACHTAGRNLTKEEWQQYFYGQSYQKTCPELP